MSITRYYIADPTTEKGFEEITEAQWLSLFGEEPELTYASEVYHGKMSIDDVPEDSRETVATIVENKITKWGLYENGEISDAEFSAMIEEVL